MIRTHAIRLAEGRTLALGLLLAALVATGLLFARPAHAETFTRNASRTLAVGDTITATGKGGTSEFSDPVKVDFGLE